MPVPTEILNEGEPEEEVVVLQANVELRKDGRRTNPSEVLRVWFIEEDRHGGIPDRFAIWSYAGDSTRYGDGYRIAYIRRADFNFIFGYGPRPEWGRLAARINNWDAPWSGRAIGQMHQRDGTMEEFCKAICEYVEELWPYCDICASRNCSYGGDETRHPLCMTCERRVIGTGEYRLADPAEEGENSRCDYQTQYMEICRGCQDELSYCEHEGYYMRPEEAMVDIAGGGQVCEHHASHEYTYCEHCEFLARHSHTFHLQGAWTCESCANRQGLLGRIENWNYRPSLVFHPEFPENPKKPLYIGMELETAFQESHDRNAVAVRAWMASTEFKDLVFVKSDSSVNYGFEIVTHPMQPQWALKHFPFERFDELIEKHKALPTHGSAGTHIHMNKEAFTPAHLWKYLQLHYRLPDFCRTVGGRGDNTYASFKARDMGVQRRQLMDVVKKKGGLRDYQRYCAVNLRNEYTIELRYPAGGTDSPSIKKNIEWALASYEFTDHISVQDVREGAIDDAGYILWWINQGDYPNLQHWLSDRLPVPKQLTQRSY